MSSQEAHVQAQAKFAQNLRGYRPSGWVKAYANLRGSVLNFDYWWDRLLGERIVEKDLAAKQPPVPLLSVARLELDSFITFREAMKAKGMNPSIKAVSEDTAYKMALLTQTRLSNPVYVDVHNRMFHHMWHVWVLPPGSGLSFIAKYIAIGTITGTMAACLWRYGYHLPARRKMDQYYKALYSEHPEFWPALAMSTQGKKN